MDFTPNSEFFFMVTVRVFETSHREVEIPRRVHAILKRFHSGSESEDWEINSRRPVTP